MNETMRHSLLQSPSAPFFIHSSSSWHQSFHGHCALVSSLRTSSTWNCKAAHAPSLKSSLSGTESKESSNALRLKQAKAADAAVTAHGESGDGEEGKDGRGEEEKEEWDVIVVGSGIGGLCSGALLAKCGKRVLMCECHDTPGGAAHAFVRKGFHFDSGPSFHAGLSIDNSVNPLKQVLDILGEEVPCVQYKSWIGYLPGGGTFVFTADAQAYRDEILRVGGEESLKQWLELEKVMEPVAAAAVAIPAAALRQDFGNILTVARFLPRIIPSLASVGVLLQPFSTLLDQVVSDPFLRSLMQLECFVLSGMLPDSTITAEIATMFFERNRVGGTIDYPLGGGGAIVDALVRGFTKSGGELRLNTHVQSIPLQNGRVEGVVVKKRPEQDGGQGESEDGGQGRNEDGEARVGMDGGSGGGVYGGGGGMMGDTGVSLIRARDAVVSNASIWDTARLLTSSNAEDPMADSAAQGAEAAKAVPLELRGGAAGSGAASEFASRASKTKRTGSFMHLHLGIDATGLPGNLECHHLIVNDWSIPIDAPQNVIIVSIPSVFDASLAPAGCHTVHVYTAGNEPYEIWEGLDRKSPEYKALKEERSQILWQALERVIPDVRQRTKLCLIGTPLTHQRYLRRHKGTYGPAVKAGLEDWPGPLSEIPGLVCCGDSTMPGIGVPAVAASGMMAANSLLSIRDHFDLLKHVK